MGQFRRPKGKAASFPLFRGENGPSPSLGLGCGDGLPDVAALGVRDPDFPHRGAARARFHSRAAAAHRRAYAGAHGDIGPAYAYAPASNIDGTGGTDTNNPSADGPRTHRHDNCRGYGHARSHPGGHGRSRPGTPAGTGLIPSGAGAGKR